MILVTEELSRASLGAAGSLITRPEIMARALLSGGSEEQKEYWLPKIASGEKLCAIAITEPDYGSDVASLELKAKPVENGWILNGSKTWSTFAGRADVLLVLARTDPKKSLSHRGRRRRARRRAPRPQGPHARRVLPNSIRAPRCRRRGRRRGPDGGGRRRMRRKTQPPKAPEAPAAESPTA